MYRFIFFFILAFTSLVHADTKIGIMGSLLYNVPETDGSQYVDEESELGYGIGMRALVPLTNGLSLRTGAGLVYKQVSFDVKTAGIKGSADLSFLYLNIPATLYLSGMNERFAIFGGTALNARLSDDCDGSGALKACDDVDAKTLVLPIILGFDFIFNESLSMELSYEYGIMEAAKDLKISSAVLSLVYNFN